MLFIFLKGCLFIVFRHSQSFSFGRGGRISTFLIIQFNEFNSRTSSLFPNLGRLVIDWIIRKVESEIEID